ncbi:hypothetical protein [Pseudomonas putida]|uniref:hypothetical protein n=1 Tax=Pseudomonas putida TaxID=303 RepID=UPI000A8D00CD|nr:hypothetical protein [Pseudomonas putida]
MSIFDKVKTPVVEDTKKVEIVDELSALEIALTKSANRTNKLVCNLSDSLDALLVLVAEQNEDFVMSTGKINKAAAIHYLTRVGAVALLTGDEAFKKALAVDYNVRK